MQQVMILLLVGLGIVKPASHGTVAGIADARTSALEDVRVTTQGFGQALKGFTSSRSGTVNRELEDRREKAKETFKKDREAFQQKLQTIRDGRKKALVDRLNKNLNEVNKKRTNMMMRHLSKMNEILEKVKNRANQAKAKGKDTSSVDAAVSKAQTAIATAKSAVLAQAGKEYTVTISSEANLRTDVGTTMKSLQGDSQAVRALVIAAQKSVGEAVRALAAVLGEAIPGSVIPTASPSGGRL